MEKDVVIRAQKAELATKQAEIERRKEGKRVFEEERRRFVALRMRWQASEKRWVEERRQLVAERVNEPTVQYVLPQAARVPVSKRLSSCIVTVLLFDLFSL